jgi:hypothetical protein
MGPFCDRRLPCRSEHSRNQPGAQERGQTGALTRAPLGRRCGLARRLEQVDQMRERRQRDEIQIEQAQLHHR